jgi:hypothetical protein
MLLYAASQNIIVLCLKSVNVVLDIIAQERFIRTPLDGFRLKLCVFDVTTPCRDVSRMVDDYRLSWWEDHEQFEWQGILPWTSVEDLVDSHSSMLLGSVAALPDAFQFPSTSL